MPVPTKFLGPYTSPYPCLEAVLRKANLRPTRQRVALAKILFHGPHQHISAEELHRKAKAVGVNLSLATVYNALHQFRDAGLLRDVSVDADRFYFDTDTSDHQHFFVEDDQDLLDIPAGAIAIENLPEPPEGMCITHVDVVVRVRRIAGARAQSSNAKVTALPQTPALTRPLAHRDPD